MSEFTMVLFLFPLVVLIASLIGYLIFKKLFVMPLVTLVVFIVLAFTIFNQTFFIWAIIYTVLSFLVSFILLRVMN